MKNNGRLIAVFFLNIFLFTPIFAQQPTMEAVMEEAIETDKSREDFKHAINVCPIAVVFGIYAVNYEYLFLPAHGLMARVEHEAVPKKYTDANIESSGWAYSLNYRWHWAKEMNSMFLGVYGRYRVYDGSGKLESNNFDFKLSETTIGLNLGKRWVWDSGFDVTVSLGYGFSSMNRDAPDQESIQSKIDELEKEYDFTGPIYGEISAGYAF